MATIPANLDITVYRGTDFSAIITFNDSNGDPINITGYTFAAQIRRAPNFSTIIADLEPTIYNASSGEIKISLTHTETLNLSSSDVYVWDLLVKDPSDIRTGPYISGHFMIKEPVSKF